jgi:hypothetical protein
MGEINVTEIGHSVNDPDTAGVHYYNSACYKIDSTGLSDLVVVDTYDEDDNLALLSLTRPYYGDMYLWIHSTDDDSDDRGSVSVKSIRDRSVSNSNLESSFDSHI